jgi:uncharacterized BrkB/YihY/UPF0761 family membrane protein
MALLSSGNDCIAIGMNLLSHLGFLLTVKAKQATHPKTCCFDPMGRSWVGKLNSFVSFFVLFVFWLYRVLLRVDDDHDDDVSLVMIK